jgi:endonuclease/exonuclease/phosphatase family metal-dependent hydrolase
MKLIQLNVWSGRLFKAVGDLLDQEKPDIITFQEGVSIPVDMPSGFFRSVEEIAAKLDMHLVAAPLFGFTLADQHAQFGNFILSKQPAIHHHVTYTYGQYEPNFTFLAEDYTTVNLLHAQFAYRDAPLHVLTSHGYYLPEHKMGNEETMKQCQFIAGYIKNLSGAIILTGDLNLAPESDSIKILNRLLRNLTSEYNLKTTRTFLTPKTEACDYIFVNDQVKALDFRASDTIASDHKALVMEFE